MAMRRWPGGAAVAANAFTKALAPAYAAWPGMPTSALIDEKSSSSSGGSSESAASSPIVPSVLAAMARAASSGASSGINAGSSTPAAWKTPSMCP